MKALAVGKTKELIHVDVSAKMKEAGLAALFLWFAGPRQGR